MSNAHLKQWHHNRTFISTIDPDFPDWAVTSTFYTALHAVDALLDYDKVEGITSHETRNKALGTISRYKKISEMYQPLYSLARTVRYLANPTRWVKWDAIEGEVFRRYLYPIEKSVWKLMKKTDGDPPAIVLKSPLEGADSG